MESDQDNVPTFSDLLGAAAALRAVAHPRHVRADDLVHDTLVRALEMQGTLRPNTNRAHGR